MGIRIAVAGLKHDHVRTVLGLALEDPSIEVVALADDDEANRRAYEEAFGISVRYPTHRELLESEAFDALVVCEEFGRRGEVAIAALEAGKHVFCDKPLCTRVEELVQIAALARERRLEIGVDFSLRHYWARAAAPLQQGEIGEIVSCTFAGPHGLAYGWRPRWYYEPGKHGGVINDIIGHGVDYVHWVTGKRYTHVLGATRACVGLPQHPKFETLGEACYRLDGGATAFGHVDYLVPKGHGTRWRCFLTGTEGDALVDEVDGLCLRRAGAPERRIPAAELHAEAKHPFVDFVRLLTEGATPLRTISETLHCSLACLVAQQAAETGEANVPIPVLEGWA